MNLNAKTIPELFKDEGYYTVGVSLHLRVSLLPQLTRLTSLAAGRQDLPRRTLEQQFRP